MSPGNTSKHHKRKRRRGSGLALATYLLQTEIASLGSDEPSVPTQCFVEAAAPAAELVSSAVLSMAAGPCTEARTPTSVVPDTPCSRYCSAGVSTGAKQPVHSALLKQVLEHAAEQYSRPSSAGSAGSPDFVAASPEQPSPESTAKATAKRATSDFWASQPSVVLQEPAGLCCNRPDEAAVSPKQLAAQLTQYPIAGQPVQAVTAVKQASLLSSQEPPLPPAWAVTSPHFQPEHPVGGVAELLMPHHHSVDPLLASLTAQHLATLPTASRPIAQPVALRPLVDKDAAPEPVAGPLPLGMPGPHAAQQATSLRSNSHRGTWADPVHRANALAHAQHQQAHHHQQQQPPRSHRSLAAPRAQQAQRMHGPSHQYPQLVLQHASLPTAAMPAASTAMQHPFAQMPAQIYAEQAPAQQCRAHAPEPSSLVHKPLEHGQLGVFKRHLQPVTVLTAPVTALGASHAAQPGSETLLNQHVNPQIQQPPTQQQMAMPPVLLGQTITASGVRQQGSVAAVAVAQALQQHPAQPPLCKPGIASAPDRHALTDMEQPAVPGVPETDSNSARERHAVCVPNPASAANHVSAATTAEQQASPQVMALATKRDSRDAVHDDPAREVKRHRLSVVTVPGGHSTSGSPGRCLAPLPTVEVEMDICYPEASPNAAQPPAPTASTAAMAPACAPLLPRPDSPPQLGHAPDLDDDLVVSTPPQEPSPLRASQAAPGEPEDMELPACAVPDSAQRSMESMQQPPAAALGPLPDPLTLQAYLSPEVATAINMRHKLYPWQGECLQLPGVLQGTRNLVYSAPTGSGKSLVAEILLLRNNIESGRLGLLVLPYNSLCQEKQASLQTLFSSYGKEVVAGYGGRHERITVDTALVVATIERANGFVNRLLEEDQLDQLATVVVDELHMADDEQRGYQLELLLTKLRYKTAAVREASLSQGGLQIVGMSATLPNMSAVADWLDAELYESTFRPVPLTRLMKVGNSLRDESAEVVRMLPQDQRFMSAHLPTADALQVAQLCEETVQGGHSVLVFCGTKKECERVAKTVGSKITIPERRIKCSDPDAPADRQDAVARLGKLPGSADGPLQGLVAQGIAYHHSNLSHEERALVELAFKSGAISVLVATTTVATGVNLPARRVIIKDRYQGLNCRENYLTSATYHQMCGRAGRAGIDTAGEAIIFARPGEMEEVAKLMREGADAISSCLAESRRGLKHAMHEVVATGAVRTASDCQRYCNCTLLRATTAEKDVVSAFRAAGQWLAQKGLIWWKAEKDAAGYYEPTPLGKATLASNMTLEEALVVKEEIERAHNGFVMSTDLHLTYLITPVREDIGIDWSVFYDAFFSLQGPDAKVAELVGIKRKFVSQQMQCKGQRKGMSDADRESERICKRFLAALVLNDLIQETSLNDVVDKYKVNRDAVKAMQERAGSFAMMLSAFCNRMGWNNMEVIIAKFQSRVSHGVRPEIVELIRIDGIKAYRARQLYSAGIRTPAEVAAADLAHLIRIFEQGARPGSEAEAAKMAKLVARKVHRAAKKLLLEELREKTKQAKDAGATDTQSSSQPGSIKTPTKTPTQTLPSSRPEEPAEGLVLVEGLDMIRSFCTRWAKRERFGFAIDVRGCSLPEPQREALKASMPLAPGAPSPAGRPKDSTSKGPSIAGVVACWHRTKAFYVSLPQPGSRDAAEAWALLGSVLAGAAEKVTHDLKPQLVGLAQAELTRDGPAPGDALIDVRIAAWLLAPDGDADNPSAVSDNPACKHVQKRGIGALPLEALLESRAGKEAVVEASLVLRPDSCQKPGAIAGDRLAACKRAVQALRLWETLQPKLQAQGLLEPLEKVEMPVVRVLAHMEVMGIAADPLVFQQNEAPLARRQAELEAESAAIAAQQGASFCLATPADVSRMLFVELRLPVPPGADKTRAGYYSTSDKVLEQLMGQHPLVRIISEYRTLSKVRSSFLEDYAPAARRQSTGDHPTSLPETLEQASKAGASGRKLVRIHGSFYQTATATGRLVMGEPNLQCVPKPREFDVTVTQTPKAGEDRARRLHTTNLRAAFVAEQGYLLMSADYNQIELRIMAHFSGDAALCAMLCDLAQDPFTNLAAHWRGETDLSKVTTKQRDHAKALAYGLLYGKGDQALAADLDCSWGEAAKHRAAFFASLPGVKSWMEGLVEECRRTSYITTLAGRRRYLEGIASHSKEERAACERRAVNSVCQGTAADIIKTAMAWVHAKVAQVLPPGACRLLLQIHDELLFEVQAGVLPEAARLVRECMEGVAQFRVPLPVKLHTGPSWGELEPFRS